MTDDAKRGKSELHSIKVMVDLILVYRDYFIFTLFPDGEKINWNCNIHSCEIVIISI